MEQFQEILKLAPLPTGLRSRDLVANVFHALKTIG